MAGSVKYGSCKEKDKCEVKFYEPRT